MIYFETTVQKIISLFVRCGMRLLEMSEITGTQRTAKMKAKITFFEHTVPVLEVHIIIS